MTNVLVAPGPTPTLLGAQVPQGTTLLNLDTVRGVWLSSSSAVSPSNGIYIGPFGTVQWGTVGPVYACVDAGVTSPVSVAIAPDANNVSNPTGVAEAVALYQDSLPTVTVAGSTVGAVGNTASVSLATVTAKLWIVTRIIITNNSTTQSIFSLYNSPAKALANLRDTTTIGNSNTADYPKGLQFVAGDTLTAVWTNASNGSVGNIVVTYRVSTS
jgi:hypothetical protein